jgi:hypothetical protein
LLLWLLWQLRLPMKMSLQRLHLRRLAEVEGTNQQRVKRSLEEAFVRLQLATQGRRWSVWFSGFGDLYSSRDCLTIASIAMATSLKE